MRIIGIDIGGTHTDGVLIDENQRIIKKTKKPTNQHLEIGVKEVLDELNENVDGIYIGTTHATNALLQCQDLYRVGVIRIAGHNPESLLPGISWQEEMRKKIIVGFETINGGYECDSNQITPFNEKEVRDAIERLLDKGMESLAVIGTFSPINPDQEIQCKIIAQNRVPVTLSHEIGGVGFIERENGSILNAALKKPMEIGFSKLKDVIQSQCPIHITQNNGSLISIERAIEYPLLTISSGPTNSFIGASKLISMDDAIIVDVGGTSTDIGMIKNGYPRRSMHNINIGGINLNFPIPDVYSLSIGGGSHVDPINEMVGPKSCGRLLPKKAQVFGGSQLTLTDLACHVGCLSIGDKKNIKIEMEKSHKILEKTLDRIEYGINLMKRDKPHLPVIAVGGGAPIISFQDHCLIPDHAEVANAYGAALAEISGTVDTVVSLKEREKTLSELKERAITKAVHEGAQRKETKIVDLKIIPYHYMPNQLARVVVTASGKKM